MHVSERVQESVSPRVSQLKIPLRVVRVFARGGYADGK